MTIFLYSLIYFLQGGIAGRLRGSNTGANATFNRYGIWGMSVGMLVLSSTHNPLYTIASVILAGIGATLGYWGQFDFSVPGNWNIRNYTMLTFTGMFRFFPLWVASWLVGLQWHVLPAILAGASFVPVYMLCFKYLSNVRFGTLFDGFTAWGEFFFWAIIYTTLGMSW